MTINSKFVTLKCILAGETFLKASSMLLLAAAAIPTASKFVVFK